MKEKRRVSFDDMFQTVNKERVKILLENPTVKALVALARLNELHGLPEIFYELKYQFINLAMDALMAQLKGLGFTSNEIDAAVYVMCDDVTHDFDI